MSSGRFTLDYLLETIGEIHRCRYAVLSQFPNRTEIQRILTGLVRLGIVKKSSVIPPKSRHVTWSGVGRPPVAYTLAVPYETLRLGDVYQLVPGLSGIRLRLCQLNEDVLISQLSKVNALALNDIVSHYGPEILLYGLSQLSVTAWRRHDALVSGHYRWSDRQWSSDMKGLGIVENKYGFGYKLVKPLRLVKIAEILTHLCYRSPRKQTYNQLFHLLKKRPVSVLLPPYENIT